MLQTLSPKHLEVVGLENKLTCQLAVEDLHDIRAERWFSSENIRDIVAVEEDQTIPQGPISLDPPPPPGTHDIRVTGVAR